MDRRKRRGGTVADGDIQQMDVQAVGGGVGNRNGNGPAVRRPGRKVKRTDVIADAAGAKWLLSATMVSKANLPSSSPILLALMKPIWLPAASAMTSVLLTFLPGRRTAGPLPFRLPTPPPTACTSIC